MGSGLSSPAQLALRRAGPGPTESTSKVSMFMTTTDHFDRNGPLPVFVSPSPDAELSPTRRPDDVLPGIAESDLHAGITANLAVKTVLTLVFLVALVLNFFGLYSPTSLEPPALDIPGLDKIGHAVSFAALVAPALWLGWAPLWVLLVTVAHAGFSELLQLYLLPGRMGDPWDFLADCLGILAGLAIALTVTSAIRARDRAAGRPTITDGA